MKHILARACEAHQTILFVVLAVMLTAGNAYARQPSGERSNRKERVEQQSRHYAEVFALTEAQTEQFDALYKAYSRKLRAIHVLYHKDRPAEGTVLSDEEVEQRILDHFAMSRAILDVREEYYKLFRTVLTPKQIKTIFDDEKARRAQVMSEKGHS